MKARNYLHENFEPVLLSNREAWKIFKHGSDRMQVVLQESETSNGVQDQYATESHCGQRPVC